MEPEDVVLRVPAGSKSIVIVSGDSVVTVREGKYGGYILKCRDLGVEELSESTVRALLECSRAFLVDSKVKRVESGSDVEPRVPRELASELGKPSWAEEVTYEFTEVKPVVRKVDKRYAVLDFEPKPGGVRATARSVRYVWEFRGSWRHPEGDTAGKRLKELRLKHPGNTVIEKCLTAERIDAKRSRLYLELVTEAPSEIAPPQPAIAGGGLEATGEGENATLGDVMGEIGVRIVGSVDSVELEAVESTAPTVAPTATAAPEAEKGLVKVYLLRMRLPSKYLVQRVRLEGEREVRDFTGVRDVAARLETVRRRAYDIVSRFAVYVESYGVWVAVSEDAVEKCREASDYVRGELEKLKGKLEELKGGRLDLDRYSVRAVPVYLEPRDALELLSEAYSLLSSEVSKLRERIEEAERERRRESLRKLEKRLEYRVALLEAVRRQLSRLHTTPAGVEGETRTQQRLLRVG